MQKIFTILILLISCAANAIVIETSRIHDVLPYVREGSIVLLDFDDTLIDTVTTFGSPSWRKYIRGQVAKLEAEGKIPKINLAQNITSLSRNFAPVRPVEGEKTLKFIRSVQEKNIPLLILTARPKTFPYEEPNEWFAKITFKQLRDAGIKLTENDFSWDSAYYERGVIFSGVDQKGPFLKEFFENLYYRPELIIFVDDKLEIVQSMEKSMQEMGIAFIGVWYRAAVELWKDYDILLGNIQFERVLIENILLSDDEAGNLKFDVDPDLFFENIFRQVDAHFVIKKNIEALKALP